MNNMMLALLLAGTFSITAYGLDNGLALTPPMGWLSWERFTCNVDCVNDPDNCISEKLYMNMADEIVAGGYKDVGYEFVNIDDCWMQRQRDSDGVLQADPVRFPSGIKKLSDYVHSKGLKLGIYQDIGTKTCGGFPGSYGYFDLDAATFASWGVDMLKVDGCYADPKEMDDTYPMVTAALNKTGRPIVFSCEWPLYQQQVGIKPDYAKIAKHCNLWRNFHDIDDSWQNVLSVIDYYADNQDVFVAAAGPGQWNDPDMIVGGNFGLSDDQAKAQFVLWAILASPLLMSNDLRSLDPDTKALLTNREVIAVNQDPLGTMGKRIYNKDSIEIWTRPISPVSTSGKHSYAAVFFNRRTLGGPANVTASLSSIGLDNPDCYDTYDAFNSAIRRRLCPSDSITVVVNPSGATMVIAKNAVSFVDRFKFDIHL